MNKLSEFIVKWKNIIFIAVLLITVGCIFLIPKVNINYDISKYLPEHSEVSKGLNIMKDEFGLISNVTVMVDDIKPEDCAKVVKQLKEIKGVKAVNFDSTSDKYYKDNTALFTMTLDEQKSYKSVLNDIDELFDKYETDMTGSAVSSQMMNDTLEQEMPVFLGIAIILIVIILLLISNSWLEPLLFLSVSGISIAINYGTNIIFSEISFVTFAIAALLQLALSMDYSIMLLDQYHHELKDSDKEKAMAKAWRKSFSAISASSLTTIFGLLAMLFMSFTIGRDLGFVLAKGIVINVLVVFLALPSLILIFDKLLNKTKKKSISIPTKLLGKYSFKRKYVITFIMLILIVVSFFVQRNLNFSYSVNNVTDESKRIEEKFGTTNQFILLYKEEDVSKVNNVLAYLDEYQVKNKKVVNNVTDYYKIMGQKVTAKEVSVLTNIDENLIDNIFMMYSQMNQTSDFEIPLNNLIEFVKNNVLTNERFASMISEDMVVNLNNISKNIEDSSKLLVNGSYKRMLIETNLEVESDEAITFYNDLHKVSKKNLSTSYLLGETALAHDIESSFASETLLITIITIVSMLLIIGFMYKSFGLPVILVTFIQGAIWLGLCYSVVTGSKLFFLAYIIAQCIQMGATIDYAILLSSNYINNRQKQNKLEAITNALKASIMTIFTSASILVAATFTIALISTNDMISTICMVIGRGTIISLLVVLIALPACLVLCDRFLERTTKGKKFTNDK